MNRWIISLLSFCLSLPAFAIAIDIPAGQVQCMAVDKKERNYAAFGKSFRTARHAAKIECKHRSEHPRTCKTAQSYCERGPITTIDNRCVVSDESGRTWNTTGRNACRSAKYMCQQYQYLHGSTRSVCTIKHHMRNYDRHIKDKDKDDTVLEKVINVIDDAIDGND
ncbi:MAG: hypothetical protein QNK11_02385 [Legionella sp.]|nr:hypothetical protein [Legionella sp.]